MTCSCKFFGRAGLKHALILSAIYTGCIAEPLHPLDSAVPFPDFTAEMLTKGGLGQPVRKSRIYVSRFGFREESTNSLPGEVSAAIVNHAQGKVWLIKSSQKIFTEQELASDDAKDAPVIDASVYGGGVLATEPCLDVESRRRLKTDFEYVQWECRLPDGRLLSREIFNKALNIVTHVQFPSGEEEWLENIEQSQHQQELFQAPVGFKQVSFEYFFLGFEELGRYEERNSSQ